MQKISFPVNFFWLLFIGSIGETCEDVFLCQIRKIIQDFLIVMSAARYPGGSTYSSDTGADTPFVCFHGDDSGVVHEVRYI